MSSWNKFKGWCDINIPRLWGILWVLIITFGSFAVFIWVLKVLVGLL